MTDALSTRKKKQTIKIVMFLNVNKSATCSIILIALKKAIWLQYLLLLDTP